MTGQDEALGEVKIKRPWEIEKAENSHLSVNSSLISFPLLRGLVGLLLGLEDVSLLLGLLSLNPGFHRLFPSLEFLP